MLGRLFSKLFGRKVAAHTTPTSRPVSPPTPTIPAAGPPPPPPPPPTTTPYPVRVEAGSDTVPAQPTPEPVATPPAASAPQKTQVASVDDPLDLSQPLISAPEPDPEPPPNEQSFPLGGVEGAGGVRLILEDGTLAHPSLDPELEERLRYIVDNIVPPSTPPSEGPAT